MVALSSRMSGRALRRPVRPVCRKASKPGAVPPPAAPAAPVGSPTGCCSTSMLLLLPPPPARRRRLRCYFLLPASTKGSLLLFYCCPGGQALRRKKDGRSKSPHQESGGSPNATLHTGLPAPPQRRVVSSDAALRIGRRGKLSTVRNPGVDRLCFPTAEAGTVVRTRHAPRVQLSTQARRRLHPFKRSCSHRRPPLSR